MTDYWIQDAELRVLGPISLAVLRDLVASRRLEGVERVSRDGVNWAPVSSFPELGLAPAPPPEDARERERAAAAAVRRELAALAGRPLHEVFRVPLDAAPTTYRASYFNLARRYHPSRLPPGTHPDLVAACQDAFRFYSQRMAEVEERLAPRAPAAPTPQFRTEDFVGIERRGEDRIRADVRVTLGNFRMFTDHQLMNISSGGMFLATPTPIALGSLVDLEMTFEDDGRRVSGRARVVWESNGADARHPRGVGLKFTQLSPADATFIKDFVRRAAAREAGGRRG